jgi:hypothetical protein
MLTFLYTDSISQVLDLEDSILLILLADMYFLNRLKFFCEEKLV